MKLKPDLSIVIVLYNSGGSLSECLRSLRAARDFETAELIGVDNASPDDSADIFVRTVPDARLLRRDANGGFSVGANAGIRDANAPYWLLLNPDVLVPEHGLRALVDWMDEHPEVGIASPELEDGDGQRVEPGRALPSIARTLLEASRAHLALSKRLRGRMLRGPYWPGGDQLNAGWVPGTAMIIRPEAAAKVGLLDERYFMYGEDLDWCWRFRRANWQVGVCASTVFRHAVSESARSTFGDVGIQRRVASGTYAAVRRMRGRVYARVFAAVTSLALKIEAAAPQRSAGYRRRVRNEAALWWRLAHDDGLDEQERVELGESSSIEGRP
jgi:N-acetylglucosaminyl-diphospho-decaprenol L-rhamnosyltransferase